MITCIDCVNIISYHPGVWWYTPLLAMFQLYHSISWVSYQFYWSIYPDTKDSSLNANLAILSAKEGSHYYYFKSFWYDLTWDRTCDLLDPRLTLYHYTTNWSSSISRKYFLLGHYDYSHPLISIFINNKQTWIKWGYIYSIHITAQWR